MAQTVKLSLDQLVQHINVPPGGEIVLRGRHFCDRDASVIDAVTTTWPAESGASIDPGGLVDLESGGFHMTRRDPVTHEVHAVATGDTSPACATAGVQSPCLPLRLVQLAQRRMITVQDLRASLKAGELAVEVPGSVLPPVSPGAAPYLQGAAVLLGLGALASLGWAAHRRRARSPAGQLLALAGRVRAKLKTADPIVAAPVAPALATALSALKRRRVDATSTEGQRVAGVLRRVELRLDASVARARADEEQQAADELIRAMESAIEAADEIGLAPRGKT
jgi:hypothetical protein